jgi:hypothetical protein
MSPVWGRVPHTRVTPEVLFTGLLSPVAREAQLALSTTDANLCGLR